MVWLTRLSSLRSQMLPSVCRPGRMPFWWSCLAMCLAACCQSNWAIYETKTSTDQKLRRWRCTTIAQFLVSSFRFRRRREKINARRRFPFARIHGDSPPSSPPSSFQLESCRNSKRDEKRNTEFLDSRVQRHV